MRLVDLNPRWATEREGGGKLGITFLCPHCLDQRLAVFFANPLDGLPPIQGMRCLWTREGETFEELSLSPSVDASESGHWHGFIKKGEVT